MDGSNPYAEKPWLALYGAGQPPVIAAEYDDALSLFRAAVARARASADWWAGLGFDGRKQVLTQWP